MFQILHPALTFLIALMPAAACLWWGRRLARLADDPALPERLMANRSRNGVALSLAFAILIAAAPRHFIWAAPILVVSRLAAAYPLRKILYRETWSLAGYLSFFVRLGLATFGFWMIVAVLPGIAMLAGSRDWMVATVLAAIAFAWTAAYTTVFRLLLRAKPVDDPVLVSRFAWMLQQCGLPAVRLSRVDLHGGVFANAAALPSLRQPAVVVSETLLERYDADETTAILAHELAHLEYYNPRRLKRNTVVTSALIVIGAIAAPALRLWIPDARIALPFAWPVVMLLSMFLRARHVQKHETASDLRAVALTGNPEALIRALSKLHAFARLPRRWDTEFERNATHPSLARRIQAIRDAAGGPPAVIGEAATFTSSDAGSSVTFAEDRLLWQESALANHTLDYRRLSELRVVAAASGAARLVAVDTASRRWELIVQHTDVARLQAVLDIVDTRLGHAPAPPSVPSAVVRLLAALAMLGSIVIGQYATLIAAWFALSVPASSMAAAAGAAAIAGAGVTWRDRGLALNNQWSWIAAALAVCGVVLIAIAVAARKDKEPAAAPKLTLALALFAVLGAGLVALGGFDPIDLHHSARQWPFAAILGMSLAGALAFGRSRAWRYGSVAVAGVAVAAAFCGSLAFLDRFVDDPLLAPAGPMRLKTLSTAALTEFPVPFEITRFWLSPSGQYLALSSEDEQERTTIHAGPTGGTLTDFTADDARFVNDHRLLLLDRQRSASLLKVVDLEKGPREIWTLRVPLSAAAISLGTAPNEWRLLGSSEHDEIVSLSGRIGSEAVREERWRAPADGELMNVLAVSQGSVLAMEMHYRPWFLDTSPFWRFASAVRPPSRAESRLWSLGAGNRSVIAASRLDLTCRSASSDDQPTVCTAFDGTRTRLFAVDPAEKRLTALASVAGRLYLRGESGRGWLSGWWDRTAIAVRAATGEAIAVEDSDGGHPYEIATSDHMIGTASWTMQARQPRWLNASTTVRVYAID